MVLWQAVINTLKAGNEGTLNQAEVASKLTKASKDLDQVSIFEHEMAIDDVSCAHAALRTHTAHTHYAHCAHTLRTLHYTRTHGRLAS